MAFDSEQAHRRWISGDAVARLPSGRLPARSPIDGDRVRIEPLDPAIHAGDLYQASHGSDAARQIWDYLPWGPWPDQDLFATWLKGLAGSSEFIWYAFRSPVNGRAQGMACYFDFAPADGVIEIGGIWFSPEMQRTRAATETAFLLMSYVMDDLGYRRLQWRCNARNEKSRAAARRLGFRFEGIFYRHMIVKGMNRDTAWYAITEEDWPEVRGVFETWLTDANFDADGMARHSLSALMGQRTGNGPET